ncbi:UDP-N-acetylmuramate dehydrogenase [Rhodococcus sp. IEGM 1379]|uniref:UDP-N-acetylmuramate dehydrogenase n=1 Tax=Rhodococcus sp. IEGM 1379 TaxID=3047086 RepID=UPI0024B67306|nr:UDP-N-acetylmuramate dehydrogenase [Rhodococcus sp. IEGM 1379]MDI9917012.1 UDP-N-acetylmuramate dehydrogenase [Rhodococcus sp. IEGM 1379]
MWDVTIGQRVADSGAFVSENIDLSGLTTLRVGGPARLLAECPTTDSLVDVVRLLDRERVPSLILAGGSNLVISDDGFDGVVVRVANTTVTLDTDRVTAEAGAVWDEVVGQSVAAELGGLEALSGIPGSTGATPVQNVGAYGVEVGSQLRRVQLLDRRSGEVSWVEPAALQLGYRSSVLKHSEAALVLAVEFDTTPDGLSAPLAYRELFTALDAQEGDRVPASLVRAAVLGLRSGKAMVLDAYDHDTWSAGSFFTNPVVADDQLPQVLAAISSKLGDVAVPQYPGVGGTKLSAGWLIERAGFSKGYPGEDAPARLSTRHTLALTNRGHAKCADIVFLARTVRDGVEAAFGVLLEPEPVTVGCRI